MRRRLVQLGLLLFLLGLVTGLLVPAMTNPRAGLSAHLEGLMNGMFLVLIGLAWPELRLSARAGRIVAALLVVGTYANWVATGAGAILGTSKGTPIAGAGFHSSAVAENAIFGLLILVSLVMLAACCGLLIGASRAKSS